MADWAKILQLQMKKIISCFWMKKYTTHTTQTPHTRETHPPTAPTNHIKFTIRKMYVDLNLKIKKGIDFFKKKNRFMCIIIPKKEKENIVLSEF